METLTVVSLLAVAVAGNILCFMIGAKVGQQAAKGETIRMPEVDPMKKVQEAKERAKEQQERDRLAVIMENIESYNGTDVGQREVPGR